MVRFALLPMSPANASRMLSGNRTSGRICRRLGDQTPSIQVCLYVALLFHRLKLFSSRHGQLEDRDPYRLKDRNGEPVLCFRCGTSALPPGVAASASATKRARMETSGPTRPESGRSIVSCDYCHLHWHLDCVDPPMSCMPPWGRKWMCPNHADRIFVRPQITPATKQCLQSLIATEAANTKVKCDPY